MQLRAAFLCDFAQVRNQMLTVVSGGITRVVTSSFPTGASFYVALMIEIGPDEIDTPHEIRVSVHDPVRVERLGEVGVGFSAERHPRMHPGENVLMPFAIDFSALAIPAPGPYDVRIAAGDATEILSVWFDTAHPSPAQHPDDGE